jgi:CRP/FNR family transcriptional regulator, cyclic AMP receptor protein
MARIAAGKSSREFDPNVFLATIGEGRKIISESLSINRYSRKGTGRMLSSMCKKGKVTLSAVSKAGKEATIGILGEGNFFGEGTLAG